MADEYAKYGIPEPEDYPKMAAPKKRKRRRRDFYFSGFSVKQILLLTFLVQANIAAAIVLSWMAVHL